MIFIRGKRTATVKIAADLVWRYAPLAVHAGKEIQQNIVKSQFSCKFRHSARKPPCSQPTAAATE